MTILNNKEREFLILLAGGRIACKKFYYTKYNFDNYGFIPIGSKILFSQWKYILEHINIDKDRVFIIIDNIKNNEKQMLFNILENMNIVILSKKTRGVIDTLYEGLKYLLNQKKLQQEDLICVVPITTLITENIFSQSKFDLQIYVSEEWLRCSYGLNLSFINQENNKIKFFSKRSKRKCGNIFTGILKLKVKDIIKIYNYTSKKDDLIEIPKNLHKRDSKLSISIIKHSFIDFGHEMNFHISKQKLVTSRAFNKFNIEFLNQVFIKSSKEKTKIEKEFEFYQSLPLELKPFFPNVFGLERKEEEYCLKMELLPHPTLGEIYLFHKISEGYIIRLFEKLKHILSLFRKHNITISKEKILEFYEKKTESRIDMFAKQIFKKDKNLYNNIIRNNEIIINNKRFINYTNIKEDIAKILKEELDNTLTITHGDLCFSNIIIDIAHSHIKLIDPRGHFIDGVDGIYGDPKYDLAKLLHSSIGKYENLIYGFYKLDYEFSRFNLFIFDIDKKNAEMFEYYTKELVNTFRYNLNFIMVLVGLLFISMPALHYEDNKRQIAQYLNGIMILNNALEGRFK